MGDHWQSLTHKHHMEAEGRLERGPDDDGPALQSAVRESPGSKDPDYQDLDGGGLGFKDQEEEIPPEELAGEEFLDDRDPGEAILQLESVLDKDEEDAVPEMSRLSITQRVPSTSMARRRKKGRRLFELAKPKTNWHVLKDRMGCCCKGYAWISPCMRTLQFCVYWPSVYWMERFLEDTTLTVTMPVVSRRVEELARPKRFYSEFYNSSRTTPIWPIPRPTLEHQASSRLRELATPKVRNNIWSVNMSQVSQVSRAAQMAIPSARTLQLAKPRTPATLLEKWDPVPKPKPHMSDYNRLLHLAMPKTQSEKCVPDRDPQWRVLDVTKKAVASPRVISLAKPRFRKDLNEGYDRCPLACMSSPPPRASPKKYE
nr:PREDICTED: testicular haploid expressed gene protein isoform X1 [Rhinolophus sinicus]